MSNEMSDREITAELENVKENDSIAISFYSSLGAKEAKTSNHCDTARYVKQEKAYVYVFIGQKEYKIPKFLVLYLRNNQKGA